MSAVYALAQECHKNDFWQHLKSVHNAITIPWCLMGDLNEMLPMSKKVGVTPLTPNKVQ